MLRLSSAIAAAELRVAQSRRALRQDGRRLRRRLSSPAFLAAAVVVGAALGFSLTRRGWAGAIMGVLTSALLRRLPNVLRVLR